MKLWRFAKEVIEDAVACSQQWTWGHVLYCVANLDFRCSHELAVSLHLLEAFASRYPKWLSSVEMNVLVLL